VVIQTYNTENFSIVCACNHDYHSFYENEILLRKKLLYPPFTNLASVILSGTDDSQVISKANEVLQNIYESFKGTKGIYKVLGPLRAPLSKIKNKYRWRIVIKCESLKELLEVLTKISDNYYHSNKKNSVNLSVDINPVNML
jgi:primosomal protein N' (replication factor Y)